MTEEVVRAKRFELVNEEGEIRAILGTGPDDTVGITLLGQGESDRLSLGTHSDGSSTIALQDEEGRERVKLSAGVSGPVVNIKDENGNPRVQLQVRKNGSSELILLDQNQTTRFIVTQVGGAGGDPLIALSDEKGTGRFAVQAGHGDRASLSFQDTEGEVRIVLGLTAEGRALLGYDDEEGNQKIVF